jgi:hypothetical protein
MFWIDEVTFLGHMISPEGIVVDPDKVRDVLDWKLPKSVHQVRCWFSGLLSKVYFKLLEDFKTYHQTIKEGYQVCLEQRL